MADELLTNILVVDDEMGIRELLKYELGAKGYQVTTATNGQEALEKLTEKKFKLIISDIKMPKMGGVEFLDAVKKISPEIEVILATGFGTVETAVDAMKKGAFDFIQKPFNLVDMFNLVEKALERRELKALIGICESSKVIFSSDNLEALLIQITTLCMKTHKADDSTLYFVDNVRPAVSVHNSGFTHEEQARRVIACQTIQTLSYLDKSPLVYAKGDANQNEIEKIINSPQVTSAVFYPLVNNNKIWAILNLNRTQSNEAFSNADIVSISIYGNQINQVIHNDGILKQLDGKISELQTTLTKLEETQKQLVQSEKLASIGEMTASIIHDLNNPLNGILLSAQLLLSNESLSETQKEDMDIIVSQGRHCANVIQGLLELSRVGKTQDEPLAISSIIESTFKIIKHDFELNGITVVINQPEEIPYIDGNATNLQQVFLNLANNAKHAMKNSSSKTLIVDITSDQTELQVSFKDTGCGISDENLKQIFKPFFTTKPAGEGTGLGLSICKDIVERMGGNISIQSKVNEGTQFILRFPTLISQESSK